MIIANTKRVTLLLDLNVRINDKTNNSVNTDSMMITAATIRTSPKKRAVKNMRPKSLRSLMP